MTTESTNEDSTADDDFTSEDEICTKQYPNFALACETRFTRSTTYKEG